MVILYAGPQQRSSRLLKKAFSCFDWLSTNGKSPVLSTLDPFALSLSKGERGVFPYSARGFGAPATAWTRPRQMGTRRLTRRRTPMSVLVVVQGNPRPDRTDTLQQYQQTARAVIAKHGGEVVA